VGFYIGHAPGQ
jgi:hypothetical protein